MSLFPAKQPFETAVLTFDFSQALATGETISAITATNISVNSGVDAGPALAVNGSSQIATNGVQVLVPIQGGLANCSYNIQVEVTTSNPAKTLALTSTLPVLPI